MHIFYSVDRKHRGKGYAAEGAACLLSYVFLEVGILFINGGCDKENIASFNVMEK